MTTEARLRLLWLASPALPIGGYAYSRGLEGAIATTRVTDEVSAGTWIAGMLRAKLGRLDLPMMVRLAQAFRDDDEPAILRHSALLSANRETRELALEDEQLGRALGKLLEDEGVPWASKLRGRVGHAAMFALACSHFGITTADMLSASAYSFVEAQATCAVKLLPLGQSAGQRIVSALVPVIAEVCERALTLRDEELGGFAPGLAFASTHHELQDGRLFRS